MFVKVSRYILENVDNEEEFVYKGGRKDNDIVGTVGRHFFILSCMFGNTMIQK